jgi:hypothetical protein
MLVRIEPLHLPQPQDYRPIEAATTVT